MACTQLYGTVETGETVNVLVNGLSKTFVIGGSTQDPNQLTTALGAPVQLKVGQRALVEPYGLTVDFLEVVGDSRYPAAVTCIQAGSAKIQARVSSTDAAPGFGSLELTLETGVANLLETSVVGTNGHYSFQLLDLEPYPTVAGGRCPGRENKWLIPVGSICWNKCRVSRKNPLISSSSPIRNSRAPLYNVNRRR